MTGRSFVLSIAATAVICAIGGRCTAPDPATLPAKTQARVTQHEIRKVIDSAETKRLLLERDRARRQLQAFRDTAALVAKAGLQAHRRADALQAAAVAALTLADSAKAWEKAYDERTREAELLRLENTQLDSALAIAAHERMVVDSAYTLMAGHAARSDTLIAELLPLAQRRDSCRILGLVKCPSRKQTAIAGLAFGIVSVAVLRAR